jgi:hypothetical protein
MGRPAARQMSFADLELVRQGVRLEPLLQAICDCPIPGTQTLAFRRREG